MAKHVLAIEWDDDTSGISINLLPNIPLTLGLLELAREFAQRRLVNPLFESQLLSGSAPELRFPMLPGGKKWTPHGVE